jgi:transcriptional regulator GlxA family with amidase domain
MTTHTTTPNERTRIAILAFDDCDQLDVTGPYEILTQAASFLAKRTPPKQLDVTIVTVPGATAKPHEVRASQGLTFGCTPWDDTLQPDVLIVAGGWIGKDSNGQYVGITKQMHNPSFTNVVAAQHAQGRLVTSVCTGAFGLVGAGIAEGRHMTTHPGVLELLRDYGVIVLNPDTEARVVDAGDIVSCGGVTAGIDEALYLVKRLWPDDPKLVDDVRNFVDYHYQATEKSFPS